MNQRETESCVVQAAELAARYRQVRHAGEALAAPLSENSYKYRAEDFQALARTAGWHARHCWSDAQRRFSLHLPRRPGQFFA